LESELSANDCKGPAQANSARTTKALGIKQVVGFVFTVGTFWLEGKIAQTTPLASIQVDPWVTKVDADYCIGLATGNAIENKKTNASILAARRPKSGSVPRRSGSVPSRCGRFIFRKVLLNIRLRCF
jgi:hypothetical protein